MNSFRFRPHALAAAIAMACTGFASLPAHAGLYDGGAEAGLDAAFTAWQRFDFERAQIPLWWSPISEGGLCGCTSGWWGVVISTGGDWYSGWSGTEIGGYGYEFQLPVLQTVDAGSDAELGPQGDAFVLARHSKLFVTASFETFRDVVVGSATPGYGRAGVDTDSFDLAIHGRLTVYDPLDKQGTGRLDVTSDQNVWNAAPRIHEGTLAGSVASLRTDIELRGGRVEFVQREDATYEHTLSGHGDLIKSGEGRLSLNSAQTFAGLLRIDAGTLAFGSGASLVHALDVEVVAGATLDLLSTTAPQTFRTLSGGGHVVLGETVLELASGSDTWVRFDGSMSGRGTLRVGAGVLLELSGEHLQQGGTEVRGALRVAKDASLGAVDADLVLRGGQLQTLDAMALQRGVHVVEHGEIVSAPGGLVIRGALSGTGTLSHRGAGDLVLGAAGAFDGLLDVVAGRLVFDGAGSSGERSRIALGAGTMLDLGAAAGERTLAGIDSAYDDSVLRLGRHALTLNVDDSSAFAGRIEGHGDLIKTGGGTLALSGQNSMSGRMNVAAGELLLSPGAAAKAIRNDAVVRMMVDGGAQAWSGELSGSGRFVKEGGGLLWLRGSNHQASVVVQEGALVGRSATLGADIQVANGASVGFYIDADETHTGRIGGAGVMYAHGPGVLTLAGEYTHTGGTSVANTVRIDHDARLGDVAGDLLLSGGTVQALADLDLQRRVFIGPDGGKLDSNGYDIVLSGGVAGPGGLTKAGEGRVTVAGPYRVQGLTSVQGGELAFEGALAGSFEVMAGGRLVADSFTGGSIDVHAGGELWLGSDAALELDTLLLDGLLTITGRNLEIPGGIGDRPLLSAASVMLSGAAWLDVDPALLLPAGGRIEVIRAGEVRVADGGTLALSERLVVAGHRLEVSDGALFLVAAPVPEPSSWGLLLAGFGLLGWRARRR